MSFAGRTPESLLPRSDSKNPATTCKGITTNGRPCRRALATSPASSPLASPSHGNGVLAVLDESNAAAFYCWQHKDQAENLAAHPEQRTTLHPLKERSSIDTLIDRVGILNLDEEIQRPNKARHRRRRSDEQHLTRRDTLPSGWNAMQGPLMSVPADLRQGQTRKRRDHTHGRSNVRASWSCCIRADDDDSPPPRPRHHRNNVHPQSSAYISPPPMTVPNSHQQVQRKPLPTSRPEMLQRSPPSATSNHSHSHTQTLLSLIPSTLSPQTTSALLAELSRPISPHDEGGYIYIFWLTPDSEASKPDDETASSLLDDDDYQASPTRQRRTSHALQRYASVREATEARTILLKIGRAANVHRRLSQWTKQCGQNITLVRYYPYSPSQKDSQPVSSSSPPRQVPHVHRVERLIHLELSEKRAQKDICVQCGREHREWFEVEASKKGLKAVDEIVKRWVRWAESAADDSPQSNAQHSVREYSYTSKGRAASGLSAVDGYY